MTDELAKLLKGRPEHGVFSVWFGPVAGEPWFAFDDSEQHYAASTMKLALLIAVFRAAERGELDLESPVPVHDDFSSAADGSTFHMSRDYDNDERPWDRLGSSATLRWLGTRAIVRSSNLATNLLLEAVGIDEVQQTLAAIGCTDSVFVRGIEDKAAREASLANLTSARDLALTLQAIVAGTIASRATCDELIEILEAQEFRDTIPAGLPSGTRIAHKSGWVEGNCHDAGIVYPPGGEPFILVVCTTSRLGDTLGQRFIARVATAAWEDRPAVS